MNYRRLFLCLVLIIGCPGTARSQSNNYATKFIVQDSVEISFYSSTMFRFRVSRFAGDRFPPKYEIPFLIGKTTPWAPVKVTSSQGSTSVTFTTDSVQLIVEKPTINWKVVRRANGKQIHPSTGPVYGMFRKGYTVFDNVSAFDAPSKINRYSHWFYNSATNNYTDIYLKEDMVDDKYFVYGPDYPSLFRQLNELIGPEPLLPKKAYGFMQTQHLACEGDQAQLLEVVSKFREKKIPLDILLLDFEWGDACVGNKELKWGSRLDWNPNYTVPFSPKSFIKKLDSLHVNLMLIHHSAGEFANRKEQGWTETVYDEKLWWDKYTEKLDIGIRGTWQDTRINDITDSYIYQRTQKYYGTSQRVLFLGSRKVMAFNPWDFRFSVMPTENMIGARRYPFHWTEDCSFSWNEMAFQLKAINNTWGPMSGYSYLASDVVGADWKIQARWNQFTALSAIARSHNSKPWTGNVDLDNFKNKIRINGRETTTATRSEETEQKETAETSIQKYLHLRYRMLPYIYSYALNNYITGMPITRPMLLAYPDDYMCSSDTWPYQYMLGDEILVAPVYGDFKSMEIYLPKGYDWIDFESGEIYKDGGLITYDTQDINKLPIFIRGGSMIPMRPQSEWIEPNQVDSLIISIYPDVKVNEFALYEDDGETLGYQAGHYTRTAFSCQVDDVGVRFDVAPVQGGVANSTSKRFMELRVHNVDGKPIMIKKGRDVLSTDKGAREHWSYDELEKQVKIHAIVDAAKGAKYFIKK